MEANNQPKHSALHNKHVVWFLQKKLIFIGGLAVMILISLILVSFYRPIVQKLKIGVNYCQITANNSCEGEVVQVQGVIERDFMSGLGYKFKIDRVQISKEVYINAVRYDGRKIGGGVESLSPEMPIGKLVQIKGYVVGESNNRLHISPNSVVTIQKQKKETIHYHHFGTIANLADVKSNCSRPITFCESTLDDTKNSCFPIEIEDHVCGELQNSPNMFLIKGFTDSIDKPLKPFEVYQVNGVGYGNNSIERLAGANKYYLKSGSYAIYSQTGEKLANFLPEKGDVYFDVNSVSLAPQGIYYFVDEKLYFANRERNSVESLGSIPKSYYSHTGNAYSPTLLSDYNTLIFTTVKNNSSHTEGVNLISNDTTYILKVNLDEIKENTTQELPVTVLLEETREGLTNMRGYNEQLGSFLLSSIDTTTEKEGCYVSDYIYFDNVTKERKALFSLITGGNIYCNDTEYRELYISKIGDLIVFGADFNEKNKNSTFDKLIVYSIRNGNTSRKEYLAEKELLRNTNVQIINASPTALSIVDVSSKDLVFSFPLTNSSYSRNNLVPMTKNLNIISPTPYYPLYQLMGAEYVHEDVDNWYFLKREVIENKLYVVNKKTREVFIPATFSATARTHIMDGNLLIVDTDHN